jgi:mannose-6-phosphate isomerase-like protein (cupin superfamily)
VSEETRSPERASGERNVSGAEKRFFVDPYLDWTKSEGVRVYEDFCIDLKALETANWPRLGARGSFAHLKGRGDLVSIFVIELPPGGKTSPQKHIYEEVFYVLSGWGSTVVEDGSGRRHSFEWGPHSLFALPLNAPYQLFNGSGREPARLASTNNLPMIMNAFRNERFIFDNAERFPERELPDAFFNGEGEWVAAYGGRKTWETNFVSDLSTFDLPRMTSRGAGSGNLVFSMAESTMHAHCSEMPVGTYKKAHRHGADYHVCIVTGEGYSLFWYEGEKDFLRYEWREGCVFAPTDMLFHQHFNTSPAQTRYLATAYGSGRYPFSEDKRQIKMGNDVSVKLGGAQIEYEDQDPRIHGMFLESLVQTGASCRMQDFVDEKILLGKAKASVA